MEGNNARIIAFLIRTFKFGSRKIEKSKSQKRVFEERKYYDGDDG